MGERCQRPNTIVKQSYLHSGSPEILMSSCDTKFGTCFVDYLTRSYLLLHSHPLYSINNNNSKMYLAVLTFTTTLITFSFFATAGIVTFVVMTVQTMVEVQQHLLQAVHSHRAVPKAASPLSYFKCLEATIVQQDNNILQN